jgi:hypothetical protein
MHFRAPLIALFLAGLFAMPALAQEAVPAPADTPPDLTATEQPATAFEAAPGTTTTTTTTTKVVKKKKKSRDFKKLHPSKKKKAAKKPAVKKRTHEVDLNAVPLNGERRGYDPAISEPTEEVMAIKNTAARKYWEGKRPLNGGAPVPVAEGIVEQPLAAPMANPNALQRVSSSELAGVTFDDQPFRLPETAAFRNSIDSVASELGRPCKSREYFGWPLSQTEQDRVNHVFNETVIKFRLRGYGIMPRRPHSAAGDISVFTADSPKPGFAKHLVGMWSAGDVGLLLLVCDSDTPADYIAAEKKSKETAAKKTKKKKTAKKKAVKKAEEKPQVVPGTAPAPEAPASALAPAPEAVPAPAPASPATTAAEPVPAAEPAPAPAAAGMLTPAAPAADPNTPPPPVKSDAAPPPAVTTTPPASPSAAQGNEAKSPVEPTKAPEPQGSTDVKGPANSSLGSPAARDAAPADSKNALEKPAQ